MIFHYAGKYNGDESSLPQREHPENAVAFREPDMKKLSLIANGGCLLTIVVLAVPFLLLAWPYIPENRLWLPIGAAATQLVLFPHEILHAICFRKDVYMFTHLSQGLLFVVGTEDMSKGRFIFMCLCPNLVFGFLPFIGFLVFPRLVGLGIFGLISIGMGFGDYMNVYNALRQMPKGAKTYLCGMHSYWYIEGQR